MNRANQYISLTQCLFLGLSLLFFLVLYRTAWLSDDAYITYRSVQNFVAGYGLTYNPGQRVQAFTNTFWAFVHIPFFALFKDAYFIGLSVSMVTTIGSVALFLTKWTKSNIHRVLFLLMMIGSSAFIDFSTSGLENPMTNLLILWLAISTFSNRHPGPKPILVGFIAGFILLNRMDAILFVAPLIAYTWWQTKSIKYLLYMGIGLVPLLIWQLFAFYYYGFLFPTTAYAKLNTNIDQIALIQQGFYYFGNSLKNDPLTLITIFAGILAPFVYKNKKQTALSIGVASYLIYILLIGGDFMSGRFFNTPFFISLIVLAKLIPKKWAVNLVPWTVILSLFGNEPPILSHSNLGNESGKLRFISQNGIANERAYYFQGTAIIAAKGKKMPDLDLIDIGKKLSLAKGKYYLGEILGFIGYYAGPDKHIIDRYALADPFLAQLPAKFGPEWRPGHNERTIPEGYLESLSKDQNLLESAALGELYEAIRLITKSNLNATGRWSAI